MTGADITTHKSRVAEELKSDPLAELDWRAATLERALKRIGGDIPHIIAAREEVNEDVLRHLYPSKIDRANQAVKDVVEREIENRQWNSEPNQVQLTRYLRIIREEFKEVADSILKEDLSRRTSFLTMSLDAFIDAVERLPVIIQKDLPLEAVCDACKSIIGSLARGYEPTEISSVKGYTAQIRANKEALEQAITEVIGIYRQERSERLKKEEIIFRTKLIESVIPGYQETSKELAKYSLEFKLDRPTFVDVTFQLHQAHIAGGLPVNILAPILDSCAELIERAPGKLEDTLFNIIFLHEELNGHATLLPSLFKCNPTLFDLTLDETEKFVILFQEVMELAQLHGAGLKNFDPNRSPQHFASIDALNETKARLDKLVEEGADRERRNQDRYTFTEFEKEISDLVARAGINGDMGAMILIHGFAASGVISVGESYIPNSYVRLNVNPHLPQGDMDRYFKKTLRALCSEGLILLKKTKTTLCLEPHANKIQNGYLQEALAKVLRHHSKRHGKV